MAEPPGDNKPDNPEDTGMSVSRRHAPESVLVSLIAAAALLAVPIASHAETIRIGLPTKTYWPTTVAETAVKQKLFEKVPAFPQQ